MRSASGKFVLRLPPDLHRLLRDRARSQGLSLNEYCLHNLAASSALGPPGLSGTLPQPWPEQALSSIIECYEPHIRGVLLFGSAVRGELREGSDIDLMIVLQSEAPLNRRLYGVWEEKVASRWHTVEGHEVSPHFARLPRGVEDAGGLWFEAGVEGLILWQRGLEISHFLADLRRAMARGQLTLSDSRGQAYWIRQAAEEAHAQPHVG